ncbi:MAG TPA: CBS domain-containing protein, partial [Candidatus Brocadiia bacterium]|nr:CBS domain-containing protein [Candidatus Brocadiia bacterium]
MTSGVAPWLAAVGGGGLTMAAFTFERAITLFPWSRVVEVENRPRRQRMEFSLENADTISLYCHVAGALGLAAMSWGLVALAAKLSVGGEWLPLVLPAACALVVAWCAPELVADRMGERIVDLWAPMLFRPLLGRSASASGRVEQPGSAETPEQEAEKVEEEAHEFYRSLIRLQTVAVSEIMTQRINMVFMNESETVAQALETATRSGYSRFPVFRENRDLIVGVVHVKDILKRVQSPGWREAFTRELMREPFFVPETKNVADLLEEFQRRKLHMGIVLDEYGGTSGLITIEDIIEELLGEIADEHDTQAAARLRDAGANAKEMDATVRVQE